MQKFKVACFAVCIVSIVLGVLLGLLAIWGTLPEEFVFRCFMTLLLLFVAGLAGA